mmetsp:Transcript_8524/g.16875  ORF Transcript_8524/g.16875 Transcript_8524/m.16875 type:complete len:280 (+) Transcript_8524:108-947(+)
MQTEENAAVSSSVYRGCSELWPAFCATSNRRCCKASATLVRNYQVLRGNAGRKHLHHEFHLPNSPRSRTEPNNPSPFPYPSAQHSTCNPTAEPAQAPFSGSRGCHAPLRKAAEQASKYRLGRHTTLLAAGLPLPRLGPARSANPLEDGLEGPSPHVARALHARGLGRAHKVLHIVLVRRLLGEVLEVGAERHGEVANDTDGRANQVVAYRIRMRSKPFRNLAYKRQRVVNVWQKGLTLVVLAQALQDARVRLKDALAQLLQVVDQIWVARVHLGQRRLL